MKLKSVLRFHLISFRIAEIKKIKQNNKCQQGCGERGMLTLLVEYKSGKPLWKSVFRFLQNLERDISYDAAMPRQGIFPKASPNEDRVTCLSTLLAVHQSQGMDSPRCSPTNELHNEKCIYTQQNFIHL